MELGIYSAAFSTLKGKDSVEFELQEVQEISGHKLPLKGGYKKSYNIVVSDEDNSELCREEIRSFLKNENIEVYNINSKFSII